MAKRIVRAPHESGEEKEEGSGQIALPLQGATIGQRIAAARRRRRLNKSQLGKKVGKRYRTIHAWETGEQEPGGANVALIAEVLGVTTDELLGRLDGQEPPYESWREFRRTPEGSDITPEESRALRTFEWPEGEEPSVEKWKMLLALRRA